MGIGMFVLWRVPMQASEAFFRNGHYSLPKIPKLGHYPLCPRCLGRFTKSAALWRMVSSPCSTPRHHNPDAELTAQELRELGEQGLSCKPPVNSFVYCSARSIRRSSDASAPDNRVEP